MHFLAVEGGPDAGFDDLVALCQVGLSGSAKLALADNYWDEMGRGQPGHVHTALHDQLVAAIRMPRIARCDLPVADVARWFEHSNALDCPEGAVPFYEVHARIDPRHGKDWLDLAIVPVVDEQPDWGPRILRGARWRSAVNRELFDHLHTGASNVASEAEDVPPSPTPVGLVTRSLSDPQSTVRIS